MRSMSKRYIYQLFSSFFLRSLTKERGILKQIPAEAIITLVSMAVLHFLIILKSIRYLKRKNVRLIVA